MTDADDIPVQHLRAALSQRIFDNRAHAVGRLIAQDPALCGTQDALGRTPLYEAVTTDRLDSVECLAGLGADILAPQAAHSRHGVGVGTAAAVAPDY